MNEYSIVERIPTATQFTSLCNAVGWGQSRSAEYVAKGLSGSTLCVCALHGDDVVGFGRLIGDGFMKLYVEELIVHPDHQRNGLGTRIMQKLMAYVDERCSGGCLVGLFTLDRLDEFYGRFGFKRRPDDRPGMQKYVQIRNANQ